MEVAAVAGPIVKLLPKLLSVINEKRKQLDSLEVDAGFIRRDLQSIQEIIGRSRVGSISDLWIRDLRRLADDMEDCIDSFQVGKTTRIRFAADIGKLKKRSKDTLEQLQTCISIAGAAALPAAADAPAGGTDDREEQLLALLGRSQSEEEEGRLKVISIAGFGGLGMTRLAHKVYSDRDVRSQFSLHAWVRAAPGMSVHKLLREIHDQLPLISTPKKQAEHGARASSSKSIPQVNGDVEHGRLTEILKTGRYLIVIDDVDTHELYDVISAFSWADGVDGRIVMTTAIQLPAATCCSCGDGSPLAMDSTSQVFIRELTESGFVETCLHLRDDTLARMQRSNNQILSSPIVQDLLLYFCMFPRDHAVRRNPLIRRWLAEGLVFPQPENESFSQDVAAKNLETHQPQRHSAHSGEELWECEEMPNFWDDAQLHFQQIQVTEFHHHVVW